MRLKNIELVNFKRFSELKLELDGSVYLVRGGNEKGKSTLIESIITLLTGDRTDNLLKTGEEKGYAKATFTDETQSYDVELRFTESNPRGTLKITHNETGMKSDNKTFLQKLFNYQDFDANEFVLWSETAEGRRKQVEIVKSLLPGKAVERIEKIDSQIASTREKRKQLNSTESYLTGRIDPLIDLSVLEQKTPNKQAIIDKLTAGSQINSLRQSKKENLDHSLNELHSIPQKHKELDVKINGLNDEFSNKIEELKQEFALRKQRLEEDVHQKRSQLQIQLNQIEASKQNIKETITSIEDFLKNNPEVDIATINAELNLASELEKKIEAAKTAKEKTIELTAVQKEIESSNEEIETLMKEKKEILSTNEMPIEGLAFDDEGLLLNGIRVRRGDISTSQELELGVKILMAKNPKTKIFRIARAESLGKEKFNHIVKFAKENNYQGFLEVVDWDEKDLTVEEYKEM